MILFRKAQLYSSTFLINTFFSCLVGVYSESDGQLIFLLQGQQGGVTHVMFSPDGTKLYSGGRKVLSKRTSNNIAPKVRLRLVSQDCPRVSKLRASERGKCAG